MRRALIVLAALTLAGCQTWTEGVTLPSSKYLEHPPKERAAAPADGVVTKTGADLSGVTPALRVPDQPPSVGMPPHVTKLAVANVHKEPVSLFKVVGGELKFLQKVSAGEAVDVNVQAGEKLAATFAAAPHCANYVAKGGEGEVWLLRPSPALVRPSGVVPYAGGPMPLRPQPGDSCLPPLAQPAPAAPSLPPPAASSFSR